MSQWSGSEYQGPKENDWEEGEGCYTFPNGVVYEGKFNKGEFHGDGTLIYPNGGRYVAKWNRGKLIEGKYFFYDNLEFKEEKWAYNTYKDRQFYTEILKGLRPDGLTLITNDIKGEKRIPEGTYDVGDGYYDPIKKVICEYDNNFKKEVTSEEEQWIFDKCRYNPRVHDEDRDTFMDGAQDKIVREMIKINQNPGLRELKEKNHKNLLK